MGFASLEMKLLDKEDEDCSLQTLLWKNKFELLLTRVEIKYLKTVVIGTKLKMQPMMLTRYVLFCNGHSPSIVVCTCVVNVFLFYLKKYI